MSKVIVGIVDDAIAFAHERFCTETDSRIEYLWVQDGMDQGAGSPVPYGREFDKADIKALFGQCRHAGVVDEDEVYARAGMADFREYGHKPVAWRAAHGTHVMDVACGFDPQENRSDRPIVCVQLPVVVTEDTQVAAHTKYPLDAMRYILDRADVIARDAGETFLPVVINFSYGAFAGPHDGTSHIEDAIDELVCERKAKFGPLALEIVLPAGNSHLSRCHAEVQFQAPGQVAPLHWRIQPDDITHNFLEIWLPFRKGSVPKSRLKLRITPPGGPTSPWIAETATLPLIWAPLPNNIALCSVQYVHEPPPTDRGKFVVIVQPTTTLGPVRAIAPAGTWRIDLKNDHLGTNDIVKVWIERDERVYGYPLRGRQSFFDHESYRRFNDGGREVEEDPPGCVIRRAGLISASATGGHPVVVGGILRREMVAAKYSAGGPVTPPGSASSPDPYRPDAMLVSEDSRVHRGVLAAGTRSGSVVAMGGTSVAAPRITRWIADQLAQRNPAILGDRAAVQKLARDQEAAEPTRPPIPPAASPRYGAGRIALDPVMPVERFCK